VDEADTLFVQLAGSSLVIEKGVQRMTSATKMIMGRRRDSA
jgi:hypothetical protein